jgi:DNA adenine methylase
MDDTLYLDPPYFLEKDSDNKMFTGIYPMRNIPVHHDGFNHELLRDILKKHKGKFVLSYNNCETIRDYYSDFEFFYPEWNYSMGNGETRIGKNREEMGITNSKESHEILIVKR